MSDAPFPIRPVALLVENFRGLGGEHSLDLDRDLTVLVGKNGAGKSSLLVAIEWCLFGAEATTSSDSEIAERSDWALAHDGAAGDVRVTLEFAVEGGRARFTRRRGLGAKPRDEDDVRLELSGDEVLRGNGRTQLSQIAQLGTCDAPENRHLLVAACARGFGESAGGQTGNSHPPAPGPERRDAGLVDLAEGDDLALLDQPGRLQDHFGCGAVHRARLVACTSLAGRPVLGERLVVHRPHGRHRQRARTDRTR